VSGKGGGEENVGGGDELAEENHRQEYTREKVRNE